jgi:hypothetical protein
MAEGLDRLVELAVRAAGDAVVQIADARGLAAMVSTALGDLASVDAAADAAEQQWRTANPNLSRLVDGLVEHGLAVPR